MSYVSQVPAPATSDMDAFEAWVVAVKDERIKAYVEGKIHSPEMEPLIAIFRDNECVAQIHTPGMDEERTKFLDVAQCCWMGFDPDMMWVALDAHMRSYESPKKLETKAERAAAAKEFLKDYKRGDMERMCDEEHACELDIITDVMVLEALGKESHYFRNLPYRYGEAKKSLTWGHEKFSKHTSAMGDIPDEHKGLIPEAMVQIRNAPVNPITAAYRAMPDGADKLTLRHSLDHATTVMLTQQMSCTVDLRSCISAADRLAARAANNN